MTAKCKDIKHEYNQYGYKNITPTYTTDYGIYQMQTVDNSTYLEVGCDPLWVDDVKSAIERHVDGVENIYPQIDKTDSVFVLDGDETSVYCSYVEALLHKLDPEDELDSLHTSPFGCTFSNKPDDIHKDSCTSRTLYLNKTVEDIIEDLFSNPYIHKLDDKLTQKQKKDLYELSLRIQKMKGLPSETRDVNI